VPSRALKQLVHRRRAIKCFDVLPARLVFEPIPPLFDPRDHPVTIALLRKKLFRSKAAASALLSEQNKLFGDTYDSAEKPPLVFCFFN
jgi:hypothetical protein